MVSKLELELRHPPSTWDVIVLPGGGRVPVEPDWRKLAQEDADREEGKRWQAGYEAEQARLALVAEDVAEVIQNGQAEYQTVAATVQWQSLLQMHRIAAYARDAEAQAATARHAAATETEARITAEDAAATAAWSTYGSSADPTAPPPDQHAAELEALALEIRDTKWGPASLPATQHAVCVADGVLAAVGHLLTQRRSEAVLEAEGAPLEAEHAAWVKQGESIHARMWALDLAVRLDDNVKSALHKVGVPELRRLMPWNPPSKIDLVPIRGRGMRLAIPDPDGDALERYRQALADIAQHPATTPTNGNIVVLPQAAPMSLVARVRDFFSPGDE